MNAGRDPQQQDAKVLIVQIAIDGPAASGKGTIAKKLAQHYGLPHLDTGLLYRAVGLACKDAADAEFEATAIAAAQAFDAADLVGGLLDEDRLGRPDVANLASRVARIEAVRAALLQAQLDFAAQKGGAVLDGRDIATRIMPHADVKLYVTANALQRAQRRQGQLQARGEDISLTDMLRQIEARDEADRNNPAGAFFQSETAHLLDTTELDIEAALRAAIAIVDQARNKL